MRTAGGEFPGKHQKFEGLMGALIWRACFRDAGWEKAYLSIVRAARLYFAARLRRSLLLTVVFTITPYPYVVVQPNAHYRDKLSSVRSIRSGNFSPNSDYQRALVSCQFCLMNRCHHSLS